MSGFATVDEAFKFVAARPTLLERLYERKKVANDQQKDGTTAGELGEGKSDAS